MLQFGFFFNSLLIIIITIVSYDAIVLKDRSYERYIHSFLIFGKQVWTKVYMSCLHGHIAKMFVRVIFLFQTYPFYMCIALLTNYPKIRLSWVPYIWHAGLGQSVYELIILNKRGMLENNCFFLSGDFKFQVSPRVLISSPRSTSRG